MIGLAVRQGLVAALAGVAALLLIAAFADGLGMSWIRTFSWFQLVIGGVAWGGFYALAVIALRR
jgi:hypothetical protein